MSKAAEWLRDLWAYVHLKPTDPVLWHCKPLLIVDPNLEVIAHFMTADVLFTPTGEKTPAGKAEVLDPSDAGDYGQIEVYSIEIQRGGREGVTLNGSSNGHDVLWYTDGVADAYFQKLHTGDLVLPEPMKSDDDPTHPIG